MIFSEIPDVIYFGNCIFIAHAKFAKTFGLAMDAPIQDLCTHTRTLHLHYEAMFHYHHYNYQGLYRLPDKDIGRV